MTYNILKVLQLTCNLDEGNYKQLLVLGTHEIERWKPIVQHRHGIYLWRNYWQDVRTSGAIQEISMVIVSNSHVDTVKAF